MRFREVNQIVAALSSGDAVCNEALAFQRLLRARGYRSEIYAGAVAPEMAAFGVPITEYIARPSTPDVATLFHFAIGSPVAQAAMAKTEPLILRYHNVTPYEFFLGFSGHLVGLCYHGARSLATFAPRAALGLAVSEFNRADLDQAGFKKTAVLPSQPNTIIDETPPTNPTPAPSLALAI